MENNKGMQLRTAVVLFAVIGLTAAALGESEYTSLWSAFKADFTKAYTSVEEHALRFSIFKDNVDFIMSHNARADEHGYTTGINQFADMTKGEFKKTMLTYQAHLKKPNPIKVFDTTNLADSVDWIAKGAVTPVKNQGQCGSCWAFSTTGSTEGAHQIATGKLLSFSEQELVDCAGAKYGNQGCQGGLMDNAFKYIEAQGDALESTYSYTGKNGQCNTAKQSQAAIAKGAMTGFSDVQKDSADQLKAAVSRQPVSVAIEADKPGFHSTSLVCSLAPAALTSTTVSLWSAMALTAARTTGRSRTHGVPLGASRVTSCLPVASPTPPRLVASSSVVVAVAVRTASVASSSRLPTRRSRRPSPRVSAACTRSPSRSVPTMRSCAAASPRRWPPSPRRSSRLLAQLTSPSRISKMRSTMAPWRSVPPLKLSMSSSTLAPPTCGFPTARSASLVF